MTDKSVDTTYIGRVGLELDTVLNVVFFDGAVGVTVSEHAAEAKTAGKRWGCVLCVLLSAIVQKGHCELIQTDQPTPEGAAVKAFALIVAAFTAVGFAIHFALRAI